MNRLPQGLPGIETRKPVQYCWPTFGTLVSPPYDAIPETMTSVYGSPRIAVEQFRPVCWRRSPEIHFEFAPASSCGGSVTAA